MVGEEDQVGVEGADELRTRLRAIEHVEVVRGVAEVRPWLHRLEALPPAVEHGQDRGKRSRGVKREGHAWSGQTGLDALHRDPAAPDIHRIGVTRARLKTPRPGPRPRPGTS